MKRDYPSTIITILIGILLFVIIGGEIGYHLWAPCSVHRRYDSSQSLPARCQR